MDFIRKTAEDGVLAYRPSGRPPPNDFNTMLTHPDGY